MIFMVETFLNIYPFYKSVFAPVNCASDRTPSVWVALAFEPVDNVATEPAVNMTMTPKRCFITFAVSFAMLTETGRGQSATHWSSYKIADGLSEPVFNSASFTPQGKLIATSLNAPLAAELDGYSASNF